MTAQIHDSFLFNDRKLSIVGVNGGELFHPVDFGLQPRPRITSCWRGYVCTYKIENNQLVLHSLQTNLDEAGPAIHGIHPIVSPGTFNNVYSDLSLPMDFTGGILLAEGFIRELYVHMGFHPAWKYETVFDGSFLNGDFLEWKDMSQQMAELRRRMKPQSLQPGADASDRELDEWITSTFKRSYRF